MMRTFLRDLVGLPALLLSACFGGSINAQGCAVGAEYQFTMERSPQTAIIQLRTTPAGVTSHITGKNVYDRFEALTTPTGIVREVTTAEWVWNTPADTIGTKPDRGSRFTLDSIAVLTYSGDWPKELVPAPPTRIAAGTMPYQPLSAFFLHLLIVRARATQLERGSIPIFVTPMGTQAAASFSFGPNQTFEMAMPLGITKVKLGEGAFFESATDPLGATFKRTRCLAK